MNALTRIFTTPTPALALTTALLVSSPAWAGTVIPPKLAGRFDLNQPRPAEGVAKREDLMDSQADGVNAVGLRLGANAETRGIPSDAGGQYYLVCDGEVHHNNKILPRHSLIHVEPSEEAPLLTATAEGANVLVLQFARPTERPGSDPKELAARDPNAYMQRPDTSGR